MSQQRKYRTKIVIPKLQLPMANLTQGQLNVPQSPALTLLREAMEKVATDHEGWLDSTYLDCLGHKHHCWLAVHTEDFQRGTGIELETSGAVSFHYDAESPAQSSRPELVGQARFILDKAETGRSLCDEIAQHYAVLAVTASLEKLGCRVIVKTESNQSQQREVRVIGKDTAGRTHFTAIDHRGDIFLDLIGFSGDTCVVAERALRRQLSNFGLQLEVTMHRQKRGEVLAGFKRLSGITTGG